jgi:hypothetical protein
MTITDIYDNRTRIDQLKSLKGLLVPFIDVGFSRPLYPEWGEFLEQYFLNVREEFFLPKDRSKKIELWRKSIAMNKSIDIPVDDKEKALEALMREEK